MKQTNELCESKTILAFDIMVFEGKICGGCEMIRDLIAEVPFTDEEIAQMRQLVSLVTYLLIFFQRINKS